MPRVALLAALSLAAGSASADGFVRVGGLGDEDPPVDVERAVGNVICTIQDCDGGTCLPPVPPMREPICPGH